MQQFCLWHVVIHLYSLSGPRNSNKKHRWWRKSRIKRKIIETLYLYFSKKIQNITAIFWHFTVLVNKQSIENCVDFLLWSEMPISHASLNYQHHVRTAAAFKNSDFCINLCLVISPSISMLDNNMQDPIWMDWPIQK